MVAFIINRCYNPCQNSKDLLRELMATAPDHETLMTIDKQHNYSSVLQGRTTRPFGCALFYFIITMV